MDNELFRKVNEHRRQYEAQQEALRLSAVSGRVCFSSCCFYHDKTTDTCVGDYAKCTVKQTHR